ncbi:MAG: hypothetical protein SNJ75_15640 [Gemmataceae bacterium]
MLAPFFVLAARSPSRRHSLLKAVLVHVAVVAAVAYLVGQGQLNRAFLGHVLLVAGIVEGATLLGWRLTQMPKSQALEFLLVSPLRPAPLFLAEASVGLTLLGLVTLSGLPVLLGLVGLGRLHVADLLPLLVMPWTGGALIGLGLTWWAYEPKLVRRAGELVAGVFILVYLVVGVLAAEKLPVWLDLVLSAEANAWVVWGVRTLHEYSPFALLQSWLLHPSALAWKRLWAMQLAALTLVAVFLLRAASRLLGHFHERHYDPVRDVRGERRPPVGDRPLSWWAVKRVMEYSGRGNLWLAGGFCALYAAYLVGGDHWPAWMGKRIFEMVESVGGVASLGAALVVLAAVPASFQYGLWDSSVHERCKRLELLLLTDLQPGDYWHAAAAAAWRRGRGYLFLAAGLWLAAVIGGRLTLLAALAALASAVLLWGLYFALGFRAFARGQAANGLGMLLTLGLPLASVALARIGLGSWLPPGMVHAASSGHIPWLGALIAAALTLWVARHTLAECDSQLRLWYDRHHGAKVVN